MENTGKYIILICVLSAIGLIIFSNGGNFMETAGWIAIVVALVGVAGGIWAQVVQFMKDRQRIEDVNKTSAGVKQDTGIIMPLTENIDANVKEIKSDLQKGDLKNLWENFVQRKDNIDKTISSIDELISAKRNDEMLRQRLSSTISDPAYIQNAVRLVYEKNAALEIAVAEFNSENIQLNAQVQALESENTTLKQSNQELTNELNEIKLKNRSNEHERLEM